VGKLAISVAIFQFANCKRLPEGVQQQIPPSSGFGWCHVIDNPYAKRCSLGMICHEKPGRMENTSAIGYITIFHW